MDFHSEKPVVAIVGGFQIGKSTLVNCLLDDRYAPTGKGLRTTAASTLFRYGEAEEVWLFHGNNPAGERLAIRFRNGIIEPLEKQLRKELDKIRDNLFAQLNSLEADFSLLRVKPNEDMFHQSVEHRMQIAQKNSEIRTNTIEPLRKRIEAFASTVTKELAG